MKNVSTPAATTGAFRIHTILIAVTLLFTGLASGETIVVSPLGNLTIQDAIDLAQDGDTVVLLDGIYQGDGNRDLNFTGKAITVRSLSGDPTSCVIDCQGTEEENHYGFLFDHGEGLDSVLEGVTIANGYASWAGGVWCQTGFPTIANCRFIDNVGTEGGGVCTHGFSNIVDCYFQGNTAINGGGVSACCMDDEIATLERCTFVGNTAADYGGGFRC